MTIDLSRERRRWAVSKLKSGRPGFPTLNRREQLAYAVVLLIADRLGEFDEDDLVDALADPSVVQVASTLLAKAGYPAGAA